jgi:glycosyl transferase, family 25
VRAYAINLKRSPERRANITTEITKTGMNYDIVNGVDGRDLDVRDPGLIESAALAMEWFRPGVAGCALSHLTAYRQALADGVDHALVLEDDVTLTADLRELAGALATHLTGAEVALLNYDSVRTCLMSNENSVKLPSSRMLMLPIDVCQPVSGAAYMITREACQRMTESLPPVRAKADDWGFFYREGLLDRVRCVTPMPVVKNPNFGSTIDYRPPTSPRVRLRELVDRHEILFASRAIASRRQRILRQQTRTEFVDQPFTEKPSRLD